MSQKILPSSTQAFCLFSADPGHAEVIPFAMIETKAAVKNLDAILAVPGLGELYIGPADLALAHGHLPAFDREEPEILNMLGLILARDTAVGLPCGLHCGSPQYAA